MTNTIRYLDRKPEIVSELMKCAKKGETITYGELGTRLHIPPQGPWKQILDLISREQTELGLPDITFLVIKKSTGLPGQIGFAPAESPSMQQRATAKRKLQEVFDRYCPGTRARF